MTEKTALKADETKKFTVPTPLIFSSIALILAAISLIEGITGKQFQQNKQSALLNAQAIQTQAKFTKANQKIKSLEAAQESLKETVRKNKASRQIIDKKLATISQLLSQSLEPEQKKKDRFLLLESQHLLTLAELSLRWQQNTGACLSLLEAIDGNIAKLRGTEGHDLRQQLENIIGQLKHITPIDKVKILNQIDSLEERSTSLQFIQAKLSPKDNVLKNTKTESTNSSNLEKAWQKSLDALGQVVILKRNTKPVTQLLSESDLDRISQSIILSLEQAKWAVLRNQDELYHNGLAKAQTLIKTYYQESHQANSMLDALNDLKSISLNQKMPNLHPLSKTLNVLIDDESNQKNLGDSA